MSPEHAWVRIDKLESEDGEHLKLTLNVGSYKDPLTVTIDAPDWSHMLSNPGTPVYGRIAFEPET